MHHSTWMLAAIAIAGCRVSFTELAPGDGAADSAEDSTAMTELTLEVTGGGEGDVVVSSLGVTCADRCTVLVVPGTTLRLSASPHAGAWFRGWTSTCGGRYDCELTIGSEPMTVVADFTPEPNRIFISSTTHDGNFGDLAAGDALCATLASQAGLTGTYVILVSTVATTFASRLAAARGWIRPDGVPVGDTNPYDAYMRAPVRISETGADLGIVEFWAPDLNGGENCDDWTGTTATARVMSTQRAASYQSGGGSTSCAIPKHFLCADIARVVPVEPVPEPGRLAFTSTASWPDASGVAAADALCTSEAGAAGLPGTYRALLGTTGATALSRFDLAGPPWVRVDGMRLLPTAMDWPAATHVAAALDLGATGQAFSYNTIVGAAPGSVLTDATSCTNWSGTGTVACAIATWDTQLGGGGMCACNGTWRVLCLQE